MDNPYLKILKKFNPFYDSRDFDFDTEMDEGKLPLLIQKILKDIRQEKGLTYVDAYTALEIVYKVLRRESNFISVRNDG